MSQPGDKFNAVAETRVVLLCARCKQPVAQGDNHECKEIKDENSNTQEPEAQTQ